MMRAKPTAGQMRAYTTLMPSTNEVLSQGTSLFCLIDQLQIKDGGREGRGGGKSMMGTPFAFCSRKDL
jgi:hypothetical protein